jgi:putative photosynthetic complex assembly protein
MSATINRNLPAQDGGVPFLALAAAGAAVMVAMVLAAIGGSPTKVAPSTVLASRLLRFDDARNGAVVVTDASTDRQVAILAPGTNGFIRATLRGLSHSQGHELHPRENHPFTLTARSDGRVTLYDPDTQRTLDLEAFGSLNAGAYVALLTAPEKPAPEPKP